MTIYELDSRIAELEAMIDGNDDLLLIDDDSGEVLTIEQAIDALKMDKQEKIENVACWIKNLVPLGLGIREEVRKMEARARQIQNRIDRLKRWLEAANMGADGKPQRFQTAKCDVQFRMNAPAVKITDEKLIPKQYTSKKTETVIATAAIKTAIKNGETVPGAELTRTRCVIVR